MGMSRKQMKGNPQKARGGEKPQVLEVARATPEEDVPEVEELPERRIPYTMHVLSQYPDHKHLPDEGATIKFIKSKIIGALDGAENLIRHVEVRVQVQENFHRLKVNHKKPNEDNAGETGIKVLCPYQLKVVVGLKIGKDVVFHNPEKHAQPTITEAVDLAADVLRGMMREEKEKDIRQKRRAQRTAGDDDQDLDEALLGDDAQEVEEVSELHVLDELADPAVDDFYDKVEAKLERGAATEAEPAAKEPRC